MMRAVPAFAMSVIVLLCMVGSAGADRVYFGHADGFIELRDEFDLLQEIELPGTGESWISFGGTEAITALEAGADNLIIGTQHGTVHVRAHSDLNDDIPNGYAAFTMGAAEPIADLSLRSDSRVYMVGTDGGGGKIWVREETNLGSTGGIPGDGGVPTGTGLPLLSVASLSNNDAAIGSSAGELNVLDGTNLFQDVTTGQVVFGEPINAITVASGDRVVVGTGTGGTVSVRQGPDLTVDLGSEIFGSPVRSLATLLNGNVAIGLQNGEVHVRDPNNITNDLGNAGQFNLAPILALAVTSSGNLVIADGTAGVKPYSQIYIRDPDNVTALAPGVNPAGDGAVLVSGADIQALAVIPPPPESPKLSIMLSAPGQATVSWDPDGPGWILQETTDLHPPGWTNSPSGSTNPVVVPASAPVEFFRVNQP